MKDDGGPAFPHTVTQSEQGSRLFPSEYGIGGMTLRDWFAGQALAGCLADSQLALTAKELAEWCYQEADEMIKARNKEETPDDRSGD